MVPFLPYQSNLKNLNKGAVLIELGQFSSM